MTRTPESPRKSRKALLFEATFKFYEANPEALRRVCDILLKRAIDDDTRRVLSLRVIEYFLSNYLKKRPDESGPLGEIAHHDARGQWEAS